ncbi:MAG TPA: hypothetical protein VGH23_09285 [Rhizomicrobium sp.]
MDTNIPLQIPARGHTDRAIPDTHVPPHKNSALEHVRASIFERIILIREQLGALRLAGGETSVYLPVIDQLAQMIGEAAVTASKIMDAAEAIDAASSRLGRIDVAGTLVRAMTTSTLPPDRNFTSPLSIAMLLEEAAATHETANVITLRDARPRKTAGPAG